MARARWALVALVLLIGAPRIASAQVDTVRTDTTTAPAIDPVLRDSLLADSLRSEAIRRRAERLADTIKAPLAVYPTAPNTEAVVKQHWTRDELLATGSLNLLDLLDQIPGLTTFRTGWFPGVHSAAFQGDFRRVRVFMDGLEVDTPDPRNNGVLDLLDISLISLDDVVVERAAGEVRIWLQTWTVTNVTPYTRTDVFTGDLNTNGFRGLFGRRFMNGALFQLTMQQGESARERGNLNAGGSSVRGQLGDGDLRQVTARVGWARGALSVDGYLATTSHTRDSTAAVERAFGIPSYDGSRRDVYLRVGYGDPTDGLSFQALVGQQRGGPRTPEVEATTDTTPVEPLPDSVRAIAQRLLRADYVRGQERLGVYTRWRAIDGNQSVSPGIALSSERGWVAASLRGEQVGLDSTRRIDANVRAQPLPWFVASAAHSESRPTGDSDRQAGRTSRIEGALGWGERWLSGGLIRQSSPVGYVSYLIPTALTARTGRTIVEGQSTDTVNTDSLFQQPNTGLTLAVSAPLYKDLRLELHGTRWTNERAYVPQTHLRASFILQSDWLTRFPRGDFSVNARFTHEYRGSVAFPDPSQEAGADLLRRTDASNVASVLVEIRIIKATLFYQFRNLYGTAYAQVPGVPMPPPFQMYGVRWEWFN